MAFAVGSDILDLGRSLRVSPEEAAARRAKKGQMPVMCGCDTFMLPRVEDPASFCKANFGVGYGTDSHQVRGTGTMQRTAHYHGRNQCRSSVLQTRTHACTYLHVLPSHYRVWVETDLWPPPPTLNRTSSSQREPRPWPSNSTMGSSWRSTVAPRRCDVDTPCVDGHATSPP
jgi:hypothetical protein